MIHNRPILMDDRKKSIHQIGDFSEMRRRVITHVNGIFAISPTKLSNIRYCCIIQRPESIFIECLDALFDPNLDAIRQKIILAEKVLLLDFREQRWIVFFAN
jgi:hypothetical protein